MMSVEPGARDQWKDDELLQEIVVDSAVLGPGRVVAQDAQRAPFGQSELRRAVVLVHPGETGEWLARQLAEGDLYAPVGAWDGDRPILVALRSAEHEQSIRDRFAWSLRQLASELERIVFLVAALSSDDEDRVAEWLGFASEHLAEVVVQVRAGVDGLDPS